MILCSLLPLVSLRLTTTAKQFIRPKLIGDKNRLLLYIDIASAIEFETTTTVLELLPKGAVTILLRVSYCKELALSVQLLLLRVSYCIISVAPIIAEGKIIAKRHRRLYDYYAFHAVNSAAATIIAERQLRLIITLTVTTVLLRVLP